MFIAYFIVMVRANIWFDVYIDTLPADDMEAEWCFQIKIYHDYNLYSSVLSYL